MATKTTKTTPAKESTRDAFGSRDGSISHSINAVIIAAKGRSVNIDKIVEKSGATPARVRAHMKWLIDRDHITETKDGYKTKPAKRTKAKGK